LYFASQSHSDFVSENPYRDSLKYQERIDAERNFNALNLSLSISAIPGQGGQRELSIDFKSLDGAPVTGMTGTVKLIHRKHAEQDLTYRIVPNETGSYEIALQSEQLTPGLWVAEFDGTYKDKEIFTSSVVRL
ncbi:MAG: FixH family protein, partial [Bdellovibrionales bacterium]|nr:FixH family protein [Bdellovibrionales bacterium]